MGQGTASAGDPGSSCSNLAVLSPAGEMSEQALEASLAVCHSVTTASLLSLGIAASSQTRVTSTVASETCYVSVILQSAL